METNVKPREQTMTARVVLGEWSPAGDNGGPVFEVIAMRPGSANGLRYLADTLRASVDAGLWNGTAVFMDHPTALDETRAGGRAVGDLAGVIESSWFDGAVRARVRCAGPRGALVAALAREILTDAAAGRPVPRIGLSADLLILRDESGSVREIRRVHSLDVVFDPAAGGAFVRALNATGTDTTAQGKSVTCGGVGASDHGSDANRGFHNASGEHTDGNGKEKQQMNTNRIGETQKEASTMNESSEKTRAGTMPAVNEMAQLQCEHALNAALRDAGLPSPMESVVRRQFEGRVFGAGELDDVIETQRNIWAGLLEEGVVKSLGRPRASVAGMTNELDRVRLAWERSLGLPIPDGQNDVPRLSGIRELYLTLTGDSEFHGRLYPERALLANATTSTMANVVIDGLNKVLLGAYNRREKWWQPIVVNRDLDRYQDMKMIRVYGFSSLSTVNEGAAYTEKTWDDLKETASIAKKGNYIGLTLEMIMADDMDAVRAIPTLLGSAAYNTASDMVSEIFTANSGTGPVMADTYNLFDATNHGNLRTAALDSGEFDTVAVAMMNQTEPGSSRKLATPPAYLLVATALRSTAMVIRNSTHIPGSGDNDVNPWYNSFDVIVVPPWTDANDWAAVAPPSQVEGIVMGWLFGRQEPEIFVADNEVMGSMFTNDEMRIKVRWFLCAGVADYRGLHKSNVA